MKILIISSKDHWTHGWFTSTSDLITAVNVLQKAGIEVITTEVENLTQLETTLDNVSSDTLIWANAYFVNNGNNKVVWLNEYIENRKLPFVGSDSKTLQNVLRKDFCQSILAENQLPIPYFTIITRKNIEEIDTLISKRQDSQYPLVLKPTAESGSIGVCLAKNIQEVKKYSLEILKEFPNSEVIIEDFLPSDDITCGFIQIGNDVLLLPTAYIVKSVPGKNNILGRKERLRSWDNNDKIQPYISDKAILNQLKANIAPIATALDIRGITRIDGRLDRNGILRFFDINGLPALCFPDGVMVKQCLTCFPNYPEMEVFEGLIHTIVFNALLQYGMEVPEIMRKHNLFTMDSDIIIRSKIDQYIDTI
ncbi:hypothetical protein [Aquimarina muelleri]|uniref:ATP-grasp domain-containing protein n=1 Tax=Aquimarina muelleri TaxID=279356 RepID=A0A918JXH5_9FLAO|nr:hypothetical protein [Aquimarina muelleri]MCX2764836.1 hypothetical protein [Aquimarina muelleri]GGX28002.1 hypothetical protein GCM10007384_31550 [Aquimarina muelleri]